MNPETTIRPDSELAELDIEAAITTGLAEGGAAHGNLATATSLTHAAADRNRATATSLTHAAITSHNLATAASLANDSRSTETSLAQDGTARRHLFTAAAIAAALRLEPYGTGPYPLRFLARYVRAAGRTAALALPEPLAGAHPTIFARQWLSAASTVDNGLAGDQAFAQWLDMVAAIIAIRRHTR
ncbi:MAG TPA: hypothetical protein VJ914_31290 [Pseudonocardiaceae bacterium]|nr:hypothetical protein [Pseudonocardiaceae bacterium]